MESEFPKNILFREFDDRIEIILKHWMWDTIVVFGVFGALFLVVSVLFIGGFEVDSVCDFVKFVGGVVFLSGGAYFFLWLMVNVVSEECIVVDDKRLVLLQSGAFGRKMDVAMVVSKDVVVQLYSKEVYEEGFVFYDIYLLDSWGGTYCVCDWLEGEQKDFVMKKIQSCLFRGRLGYSITPQFSVDSTEKQKKNENH